MMSDYDLLLSSEDWEDVPCDCPTAPRQFLIPPPPPPPAMAVCGGAPLSDGRGGGGYFCHLEPMGAEFTQAGFPSLPVIAVCSSVVLVAVLVACFLLWRHKTKGQNLLPCKLDPSQAGVTGTNGLTYEEALINHHPTRLPMTHGGPQMVGGHTLMPIELLDVKLGDVVPPDATRLHPGSFYPCREGTRVVAKPFHHPVYEEIARDPVNKSQANSKSYDSDMEGSARNGTRSFTSEDEFAEDELSGLDYPSSRHCSATSSVQGSTGGDLCKDAVSSDEGAGDDCEYGANVQSLNVPGPLMGYHPQGRNLSTLLDGRSEQVPKTLHHHGLSKDTNSQKQFLLPSIRAGALPQQPHWQHQQPSVENIYSTIDDGDIVDGVSIRHQHGDGKNSSLKHHEDEAESYGDIMPAYNASACQT